MSRFRLSAKVRKNADYVALSRFLDDLGFRYEVVQPNAKGHPALRIALPTGDSLDHHIACTPRGWCNAPARVAALRRRLIEVGALGSPAGSIQSPNS